MNHLRWSYSILVLAVWSVACGVGSCAEDKPLSLEAAAEALSSEEYTVREKGEEAFRHAIVKGDDAGVRAALSKSREKHPGEAELQERAARILEMCEGGAIVDGLRARLIVEPLTQAGALALQAPFTQGYTLKLRLTNLGDTRMQLAFSSYENYYFCKLKICPLGPDGKPGAPLAPYFDLYPLSDMAMPDKVFVSIAPGAKVERDMTILVNEGYLLRTIHENRLNIEFPKGKSFADLRKPGAYELTATYQIEPKDDHGEGPRFGDGEGRKESEPLWKGPKIGTPPLRLEIRAAKDSDKPEPAAPEPKK